MACHYKWGRFGFCLRTAITQQCSDQGRPDNHTTILLQLFQLLLHHLHSCRQHHRMPVCGQHWYVSIKQDFLSFSIVDSRSFTFPTLIWLYRPRVIACNYTTCFYLHSRTPNQRVSVWRIALSENRLHSNAQRSLETPMPSGNHILGKEPSIK